MNDAPHFLRVVRALAGVNGPLPAIAAITTVVTGIHCGACDGYCGPSTPQCTTDADCHSGEVCTDEVCLALTGAPCKADADCRPGELCDTVAGVCGSEDGRCKADSDCRTGDICEGDICVAGCGDVMNCPTGQYCDPKTDRCAPL